MVSEMDIASDSWWQKVREVKQRCPGYSHKLAKEAYLKCDRDVERAVSYLNSLVVLPSRDDTSAGQETPHTVKPDKERQDESIPWLSQLPRLSRPMSPLSPGFDIRGFDLRKILGAIQHEFSLNSVNYYLSYYHEHDKQQLEEEINQDIEWFPAIFYVVEANNLELLRCWLKYGGDPNATYGSLKFPLIAYAIIHGGRPSTRATEMLRTLLAFGSSPDPIPAAYYSTYNKPSATDEVMLDILDSNKLWCTPSVRPRLASALNLTQRYLLYQTARVKPSSGREQALVRRRDAEALLGIHLLIIGQEMGVAILKRKLLFHLALPSEEPMVLLFAGPSGHGKTELAQKFGEMMTLEFHAIDCTSFTQESELFGPKASFKGHEEGSALNNFLAKESGNRSIVFMDEFEKTTDEVRNALLIPFDQGEYINRRISMKVNCSETIWILATNQFDHTIHEFCKANKKALLNNDPASQQSLTKQLVTRLRKECMTHFGAPLAGRITEIIPFLTFSPDEAAVVAHKGYLKLEADVARPVKLPETKKGDVLVGNVQLDLRHDSVVCSTVANGSYVPELGARSILGGIKETIVGPLVYQYLQDGDGFAEDQKKTFFTVGVNAEKNVEVWLAPKTF
ncbi:P-loop containing nucleoside triphosphate hydrolase protein [Hypoxylon sp. FL1150]|nr:P-loop containing nucleoside triphosphate hydrolase protein [Hypoxylon sp. FL1150]